MTNPSFINKKTTLAGLILVIAASCLFNASGRQVDVEGMHVSDTIEASDGWVYYNFSHDNTYKLKSNTSLDLNLWVGEALQFRNLSLEFNCKENISVLMHNFEYEVSFNVYHYEDDDDEDGNVTTYTQYWGAYLFIHVDGDFESIVVSAPVGDAYDTLSGDTWSMMTGFLRWETLDTIEKDGFICATVPGNRSVFTLSIFRGDHLPQNDTGSSGTEPGETEDPDDPDENDHAYHMSLAERVFYSFAAAIVAILAAISVVTFSKKKYKEYILRRNNGELSTKHRLTIEEVLENDNRSNIIDLVLDKPGIHFNELMRCTGLAPGNLVWHLDILCNYKVIGKKRVGQYIVYFPFYQQNPMSNIDIRLAKSKVTLKILHMIEDEPGLYTSQIARMVGLTHKTVKYHVDKLVKNDLIRIKRDGRKKLIYPVVQYMVGEEE